MDENRFWSMIEKAWNVAEDQRKARKMLAMGSLCEEKGFALAGALEEVVPALRADLDRLGREDLLAFDRILERKLFDIDRAEIQEHTDGSDDGFLYARGFIVAAGKEYYDAVNAKPKTAMMDLECEEMCYLSMHVYEDKFGELPDSGISRESCSNKKGWPDLDGD